MTKKNIYISFGITALIAFAGITAFADDAGMPDEGAAGPLTAPSFKFYSGPITNIDAADPENASITIRSEKDGADQVVRVTPATSIIKICDISELNNGDTIRVMTRTSGDQEKAMSVTFGKITTAPPSSINSDDDSPKSAAEPDK